MKTYDMIIRLLDGDLITLENCTDFEVNRDMDCYIVTFSSGYRAFFNKDAVAFIGREYDIKQAEKD